MRLTEPSTLLEVLQKVSVDEVTSTLMKWSVDSDHVALRNEFLEVLYPTSVHSLLCVRLERVVVVVQELFAVEGLETLENAVTNAAGTNGTNDLTLQIESIASDIGDLPVTTFNHLSPK